MNLSDPPDSPSSFDPALFLHSEDPGPRPDATLPTSSHSDELEALHLQVQETTAAKSRQGIVIQHRAWNVPEVFRSEEDHFIETPIKRQHLQHSFSIPVAPPSSPRAPPSSPPVIAIAMPLISSPVAYPPSSSPAVDTSRKRRRIGGQRDPLHDVSSNTGNKMLGAFLGEDSDEDEDYAAIKAAHNKRKATAAGIFETFTAGRGTSPRIDPMNIGDDDEPIPAMADLEVATEDDAPRPQPIMTSQSDDRVPLTLRTCSGRSIYVTERLPTPVMPYEQLVASRSVAKVGKARKSYYGIDIHALMDAATQEAEEDRLRRQEMDVDRPVETVETKAGGRTLMWTEKYRAKKFTDLVGDERTHRSVLKWLKAWDPIVFPGSARPKPKAAKAYDTAAPDEQFAHRKILLLTGPPGLGKTTLAHVCARQAGYEVQEINASDERSKDVVKGRIKDMVGTENVRGIDTQSSSGAKLRKAGKPVCVVVDEVDGVVSGSGGGGDGGFIKALIDLIHLDQRNSEPRATESATKGTRKKKGDNFRLLRPLILICNDVYHPSLRPLRQASIAEIVHIRKPPVNMVVPRLHAIFEREGIPADSDGIRRLCEATWGISSRKDGGGGGTGEGDVRGVMVVGEWVARRLMAEAKGNRRLTRKWIEDNVLNDLSQGGGAARGLGRGGAKEIVDRVFKEGAGFPKSMAAAHAELVNIEGTKAIGVAEATKRFAMDRLREMVNTAGDTDRVMTDCFTTFAGQPFQDDTFLSKPNNAYSWLHFHDSMSNAVHSGQEWELAQYLSVPVLAFHNLFASSIRPSLGSNAFNKGRGFGDGGVEADDEPMPFSGPSAPYQMIEQSRANLAALTGLQSSLSLPLARMYRSPAEISTELIPFVLRMLSPEVKPVIINTSTAGSSGDRSKPASMASVRKASEKALVMRAVNAMAATGVRFEKSRIEFGADVSRVGNGGWIFRMEPPLDSLARFETMGSAGQKEDKVRYAVRQILDMEFKKESLKMDMEARKRRGGGMDLDGEAESEKVALEEVAAAAEKKIVVKKDFFGRVVREVVPMTPVEIEKRRKEKEREDEEQEQAWVSFHEGFSNAVRKPITLSELLSGL